MALAVCPACKLTNSPFLGCVGVDDAIAGGIVKDDSQVGGRKVGFALDLNGYVEIAPRVSNLEQTAGGIRRLNGDGSESGFAVSFSSTSGEIRAIHRIERLGVVPRGGVGSGTVELDAAVVKNDAARAECIDGGHVVGDQDDGATSTGDVAHLAKALFLKVDVANGQNFVNKEDFGLEVGCNRERQPHVHPGRIVLYGCVDEFLELGEGYDFLKLATNVALGHAEDRATRGTCCRDRRAPDGILSPPPAESRRARKSLPSPTLAS